jgi:hypothetical protein
MTCISVLLCNTKNTDFREGEAPNGRMEEFFFPSVCFWRKERQRGRRENFSIPAWLPHAYAVQHVKDSVGIGSLQTVTAVVGASLFQMYQYCTWCNCGLREMSEIARQRTKAAETDGKRASRQAIISTLDDQFLGDRRPCDSATTPLRVSFSWRKLLRTNSEGMDGRENKAPPLHLLRPKLLSCLFQADEREASSLPAGNRKDRR